MSPPLSDSQAMRAPSHVSDHVSLLNPFLQIFMTLRLRSHLVVVMEDFPCLHPPSPDFDACAWRSGHSKRLSRLVIK
jgi:hypothetical protein